MPAIDFKDIGDVLNFQLLKGIIVTIDSATDTCTVAVGGDTLSALLYYHCEPSSELRENGAISGAAKGFSEGDEVIVLINKEKTSIKVIGHTDGIRRCEEEQTSNYYIFYLDEYPSGTLKIANCTWDEGLAIVDTKSHTDVHFDYSFGFSVMFFLKRFTHNVPANGVVVARDLYFVATSLRINPKPFLGWTNFATANPTFPLVANNENTKITMTSQLMADLNTVNYTVNHAHAYVPDPEGNDNWRIMGEGESGDCEDFCLSKAQLLLDMGYPASALHIEVGFIDGLTLGHAWLVVQTTGGDYALDNARDTVIRNALLQDPGTGTAYTGRRRQIGNNWAFISAFGFLIGGEHEEGVNYYILDPLLNIFYPLDPNGLVVAPGILFDEVPPSSVNFSADNNRIYLCGFTSNGTEEIAEFKLNENVLTCISHSALGGIEDKKVVVHRNGTLSHWGRLIAKIVSVDVASRDGYFDFLSTDLNHDTPRREYLPGIALGKEWGNPFCRDIGLTVPPPPSEEYIIGYLTPFGETLGQGADPQFWNHLEIEDTLIQGFQTLTEGYRMYKDGVACMSDIDAVLPLAIYPIVGLIYVPCTNRLT